MNVELLSQLRAWRSEKARDAGIEPYRVLSNRTLDEIAETLPETENELLMVKGIAEKKYALYGRELLALVRQASGTADPQDAALLAGTESSIPGMKRETMEQETLQAAQTSPEERVFSVATYLDLINIGLRRSEGRVKGEVFSVSEKNGHRYFTLKDTDGSVMSCLMWASDYRLCGVTLEEGVEVVVSGCPEIYKPTGRFTFKARTVELVGEGALKRAYDELYAKFEKEGLFAPERKKRISQYPQRIGVVTSKTGAVIHDFLNNIGRFGYHVRFIDSRVEGVAAVRELIASVRQFKKEGGIDVLVLIRGGGSLESLQAYNNEALIREVADCPFPVIAGIGHDRDVPLLSLVADAMVSTPTAAAKLLNRSWEEALHVVRLSWQEITHRFGRELEMRRSRIDATGREVEKRFTAIFERFDAVSRGFERSLMSFRYMLESFSRLLREAGGVLTERLSRAFRDTSDRIVRAERELTLHDPKRPLRLGYSIAFSGGRVVRSAGDVQKGDELDVTVSDGEISTRVEGAQKTSRDTDKK